MIDEQNRQHVALRKPARPAGGGHVTVPVHHVWPGEHIKIQPPFPDRTVKNIKFWQRLSHICETDVATERLWNNSTLCLFYFHSLRMQSDILPLCDSPPHSFLINKLCALKESEEFCDLVFELSGARYNAHRLVLVVWSPVMRNMLDPRVATTQHVRVLCDQHDAFQSFLNFLYSGVLEEAMSNISTLLLLASTFQVHILRSMCETYLIRTTTVDNVISHFHLAVKFQLSDLESGCVRFLGENLDDAVQKSDFRDLAPEQFNAFLGSHHVSRLNPEMKLFLIISWLRGDVPKRQQYLVLLLGHLDWEVVAKDFLLEISQTENFFTSNPSSLYLLLQTLHSAAITLGPYTDQFEALREQYSYLLSSVVTSIVDLGSGRHKVFHPVSLSVISNSPTLQAADSAHSRQPQVSADVDQPDQKTSKSRKKKVPISVTESPECVSESPHEPSKDNTDSPDVSGRDEKGDTLGEPALRAHRSRGSMKRKLKLPRRLISTEEQTEKEEEKASSSRQAKKRKSELVQSNQRSTEKAVSKEVSKSPPDQEILRSNTRSARSGDLSSSSDGKGKGSKTITTKADPIAPRMSTRVREQRKEVTTESVEVTSDETRTVSLRASGRPQRGQTKVPSKAYEESKKGGKAVEASSAKLKSQELSQEDSSSTKKLTKDEPPRTLKCSTCSFSCNTKVELDKHKKKAHESKGTFRCPLCDFVCKWNKEFNEHLKSQHFQGPPYLCDGEDCHFSTDKMATLLTHRRQHTDDRPYVCSSCLMAFRTRNNLYAHIKNHSDEKKYQCPECSRTFKLKNTLDQHMVTHSDLRPYLCDLCGFSTKFQSHLIAHKKIHTGDVFRCNFPSCKYATPKRSQLEAHMRSHLGIREHVCKVCSKAFIERSHLVRHERTHSAVRAHKCDVCEYASSRVDKLREHVKKHHSGETEGSVELATTSAQGKGKKKKGSGAAEDKTDSFSAQSSAIVETSKDTPTTLTDTPTSLADTPTTLTDTRQGPGASSAPVVSVRHEESKKRGADSGYKKGVEDCGSAYRVGVESQQYSNRHRVVLENTAHVAGGRRLEESLEPHRLERDMTAEEFFIRMGLNLNDIHSSGSSSVLSDPRGEVISVSLANVHTAAQAEVTQVSQYEPREADCHAAIHQLSSPQAPPPQQTLLLPSSRLPPPPPPHGSVMTFAPPPSIPSSSHLHHVPHPQPVLVIPAGSTMATAEHSVYQPQPQPQPQHDHMADFSHLGTFQFQEHL
ncbi:uncharacterized protein LOC101862921 isoform X2 [Aplysia californica]|uniref:Uncharacterized protein LOC101862921 isoform X2 n=1 Tax=Aplysia californica TaxID=6500 RepID=A0ABM1AE95_APLCA|nr:uncharacterized protein LOC101862921 isoform X2 [Aplysia californica]